MTGPKRDVWLVRTVGALVGAVAAALAVAAWRDDVDATAVTLAVGSAGALACVDVAYATRRIISPIHLAVPSSRRRWSRGGSPPGSGAARPRLEPPGNPRGA